MQITVQTLVLAGARPTQARVFADPLGAAAERFDILSCQQVAAFLAQAMWESENLTHLEENLLYSSPVRIAEIFRSGFDLNRDRRITPDEIEFAKAYVRNPKALACRAYALRNGNGDEASGDGWRFRGSGLFQLTGRANFRAAGEALGFDYETNPDLVRQDPAHAAVTAAWFWAQAGCNDLMAGHGDFDATTRRINGPGMAGARERRDLFAVVQRGLGC